jgi:acetoin utilization deacetylase AcuC-like enzyme
MTWLFRDRQFQQHQTGRHPESPQRLQAIDARLNEHAGTEPSLAERCRQGSLRSATIEELQRRHSARYLEELTDFVAAGGGRIEADTVCSPASLDVARLAAGTALAAVDTVLTGPSSNALCLVRPPGHHAVADGAMGFCLFNNVALAAEHALQTHDLQRVLIIDWDVHHGNGTQDLFYDRNDVSFLSIHRYPFYPGTGAEDETGTGRGLGATWNVPIARGTPREQYFARFERTLHRAAEKCQPQLVLVSAGFDAHRLDPIGSLDLETEDFVRLSNLVLDVAETWCQGRLVSLLEGGYHLQALADGVAVHLERLLARAPQTMP